MPDGWTVLVAFDADGHGDVEEQVIALAGVDNLVGAGQFMEPPYRRDMEFTYRTETAARAVNDGLLEVLAAEYDGHADGFELAIEGPE